MLKLVDILMLISVLAGPALGVWLAHILAESSNNRKLKLRAFASLMAHRRNHSNPDRSEALNLAEVLFKDDQKVLSAWQAYMDKVNTEPPSDIKQLEKLVQEANENYAKMLHAMANVLKIKIGEIDLMRGGYAPRSWENFEFESGLIRKYFIELLEGKRLIPVFVAGPQEPDQENKSRDNLSKEAA